ncbi:hypothetical protein [Amycolatopsis sp. NPDC003676]
MNQDRTTRRAQDYGNPCSGAGAGGRAVFHRHGDRQDEAQCWQIPGDGKQTGQVIVALRRLAIGGVRQPA